MKKVSLSFDLTVKDFWELPTGDDNVQQESESHHSENDPEQKWKLVVRPGGDKEQCRGHISVFLYTNRALEFQVDYMVSVKKASGDGGEISHRSTRMFNDSKLNWGFSNFIARTMCQNDGYTAEDGSVTFSVSLSYTIKSVTELAKIGREHSPLLSAQKAEAFDTVTLKLQEAELVNNETRKVSQAGAFSAVKNGSADGGCMKTSSKVLKMLLETRFPGLGRMAVNRGDSTVVVDTDDPALLEAVRDYAHTGNASEWFKTGGTWAFYNLYQLACKYNAVELEMECLEYMEENLCDEVCVKYLLLCYQGRPAGVTDQLKNGT